MAFEKIFRGAIRGPKFNIWVIATMKTTFSRQSALGEHQAFWHSFFQEGSESTLLSFANNFQRYPPMAKFLGKINYQFKNPLHLLVAFSHSSWQHEFKHFCKQEVESNERLEFLGDALLSALVSKKIFELYPRLPEGELSKLRGSLVNTETLAQWGSVLGLKELILLGKGEDNDKSRGRQALIANTFEAFLAAVYLDSDERRLSILFERLVEIFDLHHNDSFFSMERSALFDPKSRLQEKVMALYGCLPEYRCMEEASSFIVELWIKDLCIGTEVADAKKKAEKLLAQKALDDSSYLNLDLCPGENHAY